jgi:hypothetical protein
MADRTAFLATQEAKLRERIAEQQRALRLNRHAQRIRAEAAHHEACYVLGQMVEDAGLAHVRTQELVLAFAQLTKLLREPLGWTRFICGELVEEWLGPEGTVHVLTLVREEECHSTPPGHVNELTVETGDAWASPRKAQ